VLISDTFAGNSLTSLTSTGVNLSAANAGTNLEEGGTVFGSDRLSASCDVTGTIVGDLGGNLDASADSCSLKGGNNNDVFANDAKLGPLQNNGGPTDTMLPAADSPVLDSGKRNDGACGGLDQRGVPRPQGAGCDIGAVERANGPSASTPVVSNVTATSATVSASADTGFIGGGFWFGYDGGGANVTLPAQSLSAGLVAQPVSATLIGLTPATAYRVRLVVHTVLGDATSVDAAFTTPTPGSGPGSAPQILGARLTHARFRVSPRATAVSARARTPLPLGTRFTFTLSALAKVKISITHAGSGLRSGHRCVAPTTKLRRAHARRCTRTIADGTLTRAHLKAGKASVPFSGRIGRRALRPGRYTATISATNGSGSTKPVRLRFTIVR
jgi:hypothetical protein